MLKLAVLSISFILTSGFAIAGIVPEIQRTLGLSQTQTDLLLTIPTIAVLIAVLFSNLIVGKIGMKKTVVLGLIITGVAGMFPAFSQNYTLVLASRFIFGLGLGLFNPLAVSYISFLFDKEEVPKLLGFRGSVEQLGQSFFTIAVSFLFGFGWNMSFLVYGLAFLALIIFYLKVPEVDLSQGQNDDAEVSQSQKMPSLIWPIAVFTIIVIFCAASIGIRFPSLMAEIRGEGYNSSIILSIQPIFLIFIAMAFGKMHHLLGRKLLYLALIALIISLFMIGFSNGNYWMVVAGFFIHGLVPAWVIPFVFNTISRLTNGKTQNLAISFVMVGFNVAIFSVPFILGFIEGMLLSTTLTAVYPILAVVTIIILAVVIVFGNKISKLMMKT